MFLVIYFYEFYLFLWYFIEVLVAKGLEIKLFIEFSYLGNTTDLL